MVVVVVVVVVVVPSVAVAEAACVDPGVGRTVSVTHPDESLVADQTPRLIRFVPPPTDQ